MPWHDYTCTLHVYQCLAHQHTWLVHACTCALFLGGTTYVVVEYTRVHSTGIGSFDPKCHGMERSFCLPAWRFASITTAYWYDESDTCSDDTDTVPWGAAAAFGRAFEEYDNPLARPWIHACIYCRVSSLCFPQESISF